MKKQLSVWWLELPVAWASKSPVKQGTKNRGRAKNSFAPQQRQMPKKPSKRYRKALEQVDSKKSYPLQAAVEVLNKFPKAKFDESVEVAFHLGVDPKQSDQMVRGTVPL